jgi:SAM-dependent methyltransferase
MGDHREYGGYRRWKNWASQSFGDYSKSDAAYFSAELRAAGLLTGSPLKILELGFGHGHFAGWAIAQGHNYTGVEIIEDLVELARATGIPTVQSGEVRDRFTPATLDLVVAFDVLEHLDLNVLLEQLRLFRDLLKPGGCLLARTPSGDSPFGRAMQYGDITHRLVLGSSAVEQIAGLCGFDVRRIGAPALPISGVPVITGVRRVGLRILQQVLTALVRLAFHSNRKTVIDAAMVFVLCRPDVDTKQHSAA